MCRDRTYRTHIGAQTMLTKTETGDRLTSDRTSHTAERTHGGWRLSYLPDRNLTEAQALAGMYLADVIADPLTGWEHRWVQEWAEKLGSSVHELTAAVRSR